jgi:small GTP-binding protein
MNDVNRFGIEYQISVMIVGVAGVGKTTYFKHLISDDSASRIEPTQPTIGCDFRVITVHLESLETNILVSLVDSPGNTNTNRIAVPRSYTDKLDVMLFVYDITDKKSFDNLATWVDFRDSACPNVDSGNFVSVLVGNKLDLVKSGKAKKAVDTHTASAFALEIGAKGHFYELSALEMGTPECPAPCRYPLNIALREVVEQRRRNKAPTYGQLMQQRQLNNARNPLKLQDDVDKDNGSKCC